MDYTQNQRMSRMRLPFDSFAGPAAASIRRRLHRGALPVSLPHQIESVADMNYFAHGIGHLDPPCRLAGTATPDWLSVADRGVRVRERTVRPFLEHDDPDVAEFAAGVLQHLEDDRWFHKTRAFFEVTGEMTSLLRQRTDCDDRFRASFLGHIITELLLDDVLREIYPQRLDQYYEVLNDLDPRFIESVVNRMARGRTERLGLFVGLFVQERFLYDYEHPERLLFRLNQVMRRVRLSALPDSTIGVLEAGREVVKDRSHDLLPPEAFDWPPLPET